MAKVKLVFSDEDGGVAISMEDENGTFDDAEKTGKMTAAQELLIQTLSMLEFQADEVFVGDELVGGLEHESDEPRH